MKKECIIDGYGVAHFVYVIDEEETLDLEQIGKELNELQELFCLTEEKINGKSL